MNFHENEEAVSPVIGVILMVAITVILAAVIAVFVFGMAGDVQSTKSVAATAKVSTNAAGDPVLVVTYQGGPDNGMVEVVQVKVDDEDGVIHTWTSVVEGDATVTEVGDSISLALTAGELNTYVVKADFKDGSEQVILQGTIDVPA
ncbi:MAG TPA: type IV pilin [Methanoculleus sp.]|nr:type IV pilin [Methanoculleus sp.]